MTTYHVCANEMSSFHEADSAAEAADAFARSRGYSNAGEMDEELQPEAEILVSTAEEVSAGALLRIEASVGDALLDDIAELRRSVQGLADAVAETAGLLAQLSGGRKTNGGGR